MCSSISVNGCQNKGLEKKEVAIFKSIIVNNVLKLKKEVIEGPPGVEQEK